jgi:hypothetical protein
VAHELFELPMLARAFRSGDAPFSVMRELTRVVVPENQEEWLAASEGKTAAQVQQMVSGLRKGANPEDRPDPKLVRHRIVLDVDGETHAMWMAGRTHADQRHGARLTDDEVARQAAQAMIEPGGDGTSAPCLHAVTTCKQCKRSSLVANGQEVPLDMATTLRMMCDSARVGDLESDEIERLVPAIPYPTRRKAFIRARFACEVPGCRSKRCLDVHHIVFRSMGGSNKLSNLVVVCSGHHQALHEGRLSITGRSPDDLVFEFRRDWDEGVHRTMTTVPGEVFLDGEDVTDAIPVVSSDAVPAGTDERGAETDDAVPAMIDVAVPAGIDVAVQAGTDVAVQAGTDVAVQAGTDVAVQAGTDVAVQAGTDVAVPAGTDVAVPAGTSVAVPAGTDVAVPAGTDVAVPAGTDVAVPAGTREDRAGLERLVTAMTSALAHTPRTGARGAGPVPGTRTG